LLPGIPVNRTGRSSEHRGEIKRRPEVETLVVATDNRTEVIRKALDSLAQASDEPMPSLEFRYGSY
jgi:hypothetical protein